MYLSHTTMTDLRDRKNIEGKTFLVYHLKVVVHKSTALPLTETDLLFQDTF